MDAPAHDQMWSSCDNLRNLVRKLCKPGSKYASSARVRLQELMDLPVIVTEKIDGSNVTVVYDLASQEFSYRSRRLMLPDHHLNKLDLRPILKPYHVCVIRLWTLLANAQPELVARAVQFMVFGELHTGDQDHHCVGKNNGFSYGTQPSWQVFGYKVVSPPDPTVELAEGEEPKPVVTTRWLNKDTLKQLHLAQLPIPPLMAPPDAKLADVVASLHDRMMGAKRPIEGLFFTSYEPDQARVLGGKGIKYKIGRMDDCPITYLGHELPMSQWSPERLAAYEVVWGTQALKFVQLVDETFFSRPKALQRNKPKEPPSPAQLVWQQAQAMVTPELVRSELSKINLPSKEELRALDKVGKRELIERLSTAVCRDLEQSLEQIEADLTLLEPQRPKLQGYISKAVATELFRR